MKHRMILFILVILILSTLIIQEPVKVIVSAQNVENIYDMPADTDCVNVISNNNFTDAPTHGTNGTSGEFSTDFQRELTPSPFNYVELKWQHSPGGSLQPRNKNSISEQEPATWDYAYFSTPMHWEYEILPISCLSILEFEVECTGDFSQSALSAGLFQVIVLLIDSSGKIARLHSEDSLTNSTYRYYSNQLTSWVVEYAWEGIIEDVAGNQDAPIDIAEVRVVLAPTYRFFLDSDAPVSTFDGSVTIRCRYIDLQVLIDIPPFSSVTEPKAIGSIGHNTSINYIEMAVNPNGSIFSLGRTYLIPDWGVIVRWDTNAQPMWIKEWQDDAPGAIAATSNRIYTVGQHNNDLSLAVWSTDGNLIKEFFYNISHSDFGADICVISTGELFILGYSRYQDEYTPFLLKLNPDYSVKTQIMFDTRNYRTTYQLHLTDSGGGYIQIGESFTKIVDEFISSSEIEFNADSFIVTSEGNLWCSSGTLGFETPLFNYRRDLRVSRVFAADSTNIQSTIIRFRYSPTYYDSSWQSNIVMDANEKSIYTLVYKGTNFVQYLIVKMDLDGSVIWHKSIENRMTGAWPDDWNIWDEIRVLNDTSICVAGTDLQGYYRNLTLAIIDIRGPSWSETIDWIMIGAIVGVVVVADVAIIYYFKRRKEPSKKRKADLGELFDDLFENA